MCACFVACYLVKNRAEIFLDFEYLSVCPLQSYKKAVSYGGIPRNFLGDAVFAFVIPLAVHRDVDCRRVPGDEKSEGHYNCRMVFA